MFRAAAIDLPAIRNGEEFWPTYALITHAIELSLKAFAYHCIDTGRPARNEPKQHDLVGWYRLAVEYGLPERAEVKENIDLLNELHVSHYTRYPGNRSSPLPDVDTIIDSTVDYLISAFTESINPR